jgi:hypothetical protein
MAPRYRNTQAGPPATPSTEKEENTMKRVLAIAMGLLVIGSALFGCASQMGRAEDGWVTLLDGSNLNSWNAIGNANWRLTEGSVQAEIGNGFLVSKKSYQDFQIRAEFWVDNEANSGIFIRCEDEKKVTATNSYEVNIFDTRPDPSYGTGAIVNIATVSPMPKAGGKWNLFEITAKGSQLTVTLNGVRTVDVQDSKHPRGPIALQYGGGVVKFRSVQIRTL